MKFPILLPVLSAAVFVLAGTLAPAASLPASSAQELKLVNLDYDSLVKTREAIQDGHAKISPAYDKLVADADALLKQEGFSVLQKKYTAASGDKRDYFDIGFYSWPNPETKDGMPYIRRDGHRNPEANGPEFDKRGFNSTMNRVRLLGLAYFYTGEEKYAAKAGEFLRTWFTDPEGGMNPNMNHAAALPGVMDGSYIGIINTVALIDMLDAVKLITLSESWTDADDKALQGWFEQYTDWLLNSDFGKKEGSMRNNHGVWYAAQVAAYSIYFGKPENVTLMIDLGRQHVDDQIAADGGLPAELRRNRSLMYSRYALYAFSSLARAGTVVGGDRNDLWHYKTADGRGLETAFNFLAPYLAGEKEWTWEQLKENSYPGTVQVLSWPTRVYDSPAIDHAAEVINPLNNATAINPPYINASNVWLRSYYQHPEQ